MMRPRALLLALMLLPCGFAAGAEDIGSTGATDASTVTSSETSTEAAALPLPTAETISLDGAQYVTQIERPVDDPTMVNGAQIDLSQPITGSVRVARADGSSMSDEAYRARDVLEATCAAQGMIANAGAAPILGSDGAWVFVVGCL